MLYNMWIIWVLILIIVIVGCSFKPAIETFVGYPLPRVRHLMSYDLRGDIPIPYHPVSPWNNPEVGPIYNEPIFV